MCGFPMHNEDLYLSRLAEKDLMPIARAMADKVMTKENGIPDDAVARAKPSVIKKLEENMKIVDMGKWGRKNLLMKQDKRVNREPFFSTILKSIEKYTIM